MRIATEESYISHNSDVNEDWCLVLLYLTQDEIALHKLVPCKDNNISEQVSEYDWIDMPPAHYGELSDVLVAGYGGMWSELGADDAFHDNQTRTTESLHCYYSLAADHEILPRELEQTMKCNVPAMNVTTARLALRRDRDRM